MAQAPVVDRTQVTQDVEPRYTEQIHALRDQIGAFAIPADAPRAQKAQRRREKTQLQQALQALLSAQEAEITRHVKRGATARHKLDTLVKTVSGYPDTLRRKVGKASVDVLPRMIWIYDFERQGDDDWRAAKRDARRFLRQVRQGSGTPVAVEAP